MRIYTVGGVVISNGADESEEKIRENLEKFLKVFNGWEIFWFILDVYDADIPDSVYLVVEGCDKEKFPFSYVAKMFEFENNVPKEIYAFYLTNMRLKSLEGEAKKWVENVYRDIQSGEMERRDKLFNEMQKYFLSVMENPRTQEILRDPELGDVLRERLFTFPTSEEGLDEIKNKIDSLLCA